MLANIIFSQICSKKLNFWNIEDNVPAGKLKKEI
jgi:hypothetical protein